MCEEQVRLFPQVKPIVMIFTPTSWLIPRPTYKAFRKEWDKHFSFHSGFIITSNEFFSIKGIWPLAFTMWTYDFHEEGNANTVQLFELTGLKKYQLNNVNWNLDDTELNFQLNDILNNVKQVKLDNSRGTIRNLMPEIELDGRFYKQPRYNFYRSINNDEKDIEYVSGFPKKDNRHKTLKAIYGYADGNVIGFMDDLTPVRLRQEQFNRQSNKPDRVWFSWIFHL